MSTLLYYDEYGRPKRFIPSRKCGCGDCWRIERQCPQADSPHAVQLFMPNPNTLPLGGAELDAHLQEIRSLRLHGSLMGERRKQRSDQAEREVKRLMATLVNVD